MEGREKGKKGKREGGKERMRLSGIWEKERMKGGKEGREEGRKKGREEGKRG